MDIPCQKSTRRVRLQGFKGFRLKSTQVLRRNTFSKTFSKDALQKLKQPLATAIPIGGTTNHNDLSLRLISQTPEDGENTKNNVKENIDVPNNEAAGGTDLSSLKVAPIHGMLVASCKVVLQNEPSIKAIEQRDESIDDKQRSTKRVGSFENDDNLTVEKKARTSEVEATPTNSNLQQFSENQRLDFTSKSPEQLATISNITKENFDANSYVSPLTVSDGADLIDLATKNCVNASDAINYKNFDVTTEQACSPYADIDNVPSPIKLLPHGRSTPTDGVELCVSPTQINSSSNSNLVDVISDEKRLQPAPSQSKPAKDDNIKPVAVCNNRKIAINGIVSSSPSYCSSNNDTITTASLCFGTVSNERDMLSYPAKKRYHKWFNSRPVKNEYSPKSDSMSSCIQNEALDPAPQSVAETTCDSFANKKELNSKCISSNGLVRQTLHSDSTYESVEGDADSAVSNVTVPETINDTGTLLNLVEAGDSASKCASKSNDELGMVGNTLPLPNQNECSSSPTSSELSGEQDLRNNDVASSTESNNELVLPLKDQLVSPQYDSTSTAVQEITSFSKDSTSPLLPAESPVMDYTLSDTSSLSGSLSPIDIRIPIDNCHLQNASPMSEECSENVNEFKTSPDNEPSQLQSDPAIFTSEDKIPMFSSIQENVYLFQKKKSRARKEIRRMLCECINNLEEPPCGENCLNRLLMIECSARCPFGDLCTNKRFQRREYLRTEVFKTSWKGWGLRAAADLPPGQLVMEYCGEVLDAAEFYRRSHFYAENNQQHFYFMALSQDEIIDATYKGNISRFINHSCKPNCETQKWTVNGRLCIGIFTLDEVKAGEEITFDYQFESYGKERQKCYCGASTCRGYLGKAASQNNFVVRDKLVEGSEPAKVVKEFKENSVETELQRLTSGLQTTKEVLLLCRLMVRSESTDERLLCLKVLRRTGNQAFLRAFLHFHGLSLMWSWMVDLEGATPLKVEILATLAILPISNKNVLEDSKVLPMVVRWSEGESSTPHGADSHDDGSQQDESSVANRTDSTKENNELSQKIISLSLALLNVWRNLKEIYRIPKRTKVSESKESDEETKAKVSSPAKQTENHAKTASVDRRSSLKHRQSPSKTRPRDDDNRSSKHESGSESRLRRKEHRKQFERDMLNRNTKLQKQRHHSPSKSRSSTPLTPLIAASTPPQPALRDGAENFPTGGYSGNLIEITPEPSTLPSHTVHHSVSTEGQPISVIGASSQPILSSPLMGMLATPYSVQAAPQMAPVNNLPGVTVLGYDGPNIIVSLTPDQLKELTDLLAFKSLQQATLQQPLLTHLPLSTPLLPPQPAPPTQPVAPLTPLLPPQPAAPTQPAPPLSSPTVPPEQSIASVASNPVDTSLIQPGIPLIPKATPSLRSQNTNPSLESTPAPTPTASSDADKSPARDPRPPLLPPNWKTASDEDGCVYYYHVITRQTQWDPPTWDASADDLVGRKEGEMELSTPKADDKKPASNLSSSGVIASDSSQARRAKEAFRSRMSQHIVTCLSAYRKADCKVGRIQTTDDFKKLARKLTHNILMKEIKQVQVWEDLECNANVKHKAKEYVRKYMAKMGPVYRGKEDR